MLEGRGFSEERTFTTCAPIVSALTSGGDPSVVYGLWGIFVLAPFVREYLGNFLQTYLGFIPIFQGRLTGIGMMTGGIILAIMITPIITSVVRDVLEAVPVTQREAALALGARSGRHSGCARQRLGLAGSVVLVLWRAIARRWGTMVIGTVLDNGRTLRARYTIAPFRRREFRRGTGSLYFQS